METTLEERRRVYVLARIAREEADAEAEERKLALKEAERAFVEAMLDAEQKSIKTLDGVTFTVSPRMFISCTLDNKDEVAAWLEERGFERADICREELAAKRVREIVRKVYHEEGKDKIPECLKVDDTPGISVTGWTKVNGEVEVES